VCPAPQRAKGTRRQPPRGARVNDCERANASEQPPRSCVAARSVVDAREHGGKIGKPSERANPLHKVHDVEERSSGWVRPKGALTPLHLVYPFARSAFRACSATATATATASATAAATAAAAAAASATAAATASATASPHYALRFAFAPRALALRALALCAFAPCASTPRACGKRAPPPTFTFTLTCLSVASPPSENWLSAISGQLSARRGR
jgi:hypothetical protein